MRLLTVAVAGLPALLLGGCIAGVVLVAPLPSSQAACGYGEPVVVVGLPPGTAIAGYSGEQLVNAAAIVDAGHALDVSPHGQTIAVMTAMGESSLRVLDRGDAAGPDSRGLFQQRDNGAWGAYEQRMDPTASATAFYQALLEVDGWQTLPPTLAANRTQRNADPWHYERFWDPAVQVVEALAGRDVPGLVTGAGGHACQTAQVGGVPATGWTRPSPGRVTSGFGYRIHPITGVYKLHSGMDFAGPCGSPIVAAAQGTVVRAGPAPGYGYVVYVDHGQNEQGRQVVTAYAHMFAQGILTHVGERVTAGQQIATVGTSGSSTGCHLHFEVRVDGEPIDPASYLAARGVVT